MHMSAVIVSADTRGHVFVQFENMIVLLKNWFQSKNILMNLKKTHFMPVKKNELKLFFSFKLTVIRIYQR